MSSVHVKIDVILSGNNHVNIVSVLKMSALYETVHYYRHKFYIIYIMNEGRKEGTAVPVLK
jgi:hypothetical protein